MSIVFDKKNAQKTSFFRLFFVHIANPFEVNSG